MKTSQSYIARMEGRNSASIGRCPQAFPQGRLRIIFCTECYSLTHRLPRPYRRGSIPACGRRSNRRQVALDCDGGERDFCELEPDW
jgi:hypothetical protein